MADKDMNLFYKTYGSIAGNFILFCVGCPEESAITKKASGLIVKIAEFVLGKAKTLESKEVNAVLTKQFGKLIPVHSTSKAALEQMTDQF